MSKAVILGTYENIGIFKPIGFETIVVNSAVQTKEQLEKLVTEDVAAVFIQEDFFAEEFYPFKKQFKSLITIPFSDTKESKGINFLKKSVLNATGSKNILGKD